MCLLAHLWLGLLQRPICILLFRHPLPVAISLSVRFFPLSLFLSFCLSVSTMPTCLCVMWHDVNPSNNCGCFQARYFVEELKAKDWLAVWQKSIVHALKSCQRRGAPIVFVSYEHLVRDPRDALVSLHAELV